MQSKTITNKSNNHHHNLEYLCYNKIKSIPKKKFGSKNSFSNLDISHYNNSIEIDKKVNSKLKKINRNNIHQKPILSERIKRNYSNGNKNSQNQGWLPFEKNNIYKTNNTEINSYNNLLNLANISLFPSSNGKNNKSNIFDKNIIIKNNNFDKKIIFDNYDDKNIMLQQSQQDIYNYEKEKIKNKMNINSKQKVCSSQSSYQYTNYNKKKKKRSIFK